MARIGCIIQARLDSTRLCHKVLKSIFYPGPPTLEYIIFAAQHAKLVNDVCLTTPDLALFYLARDTYHIYPHWYTGPRDCVAEYYLVAKACRYDIIVRLTADCPMLTGEIIDRAVGEFFKADADVIYAGPDGADVEVFTMSALAQAYEKATGEEREHVCYWMRRNLRYKELPPLPGKWKSVDTLADFQYIQQLLAKDN